MLNIIAFVSLKCLIKTVQQGCVDFLKRAKWSQLIVGCQTKIKSKMGSRAVIEKGLGPKLDDINRSHNMKVED